MSVANEYGVHENTVLKWKRQYRTNPELAFSGEGGVTPPDETERMDNRDSNAAHDLPAHIRPDAKAFDHLGDTGYLLPIRYHIG